MGLASSKSFLQFFRRLQLLGVLLAAAASAQQPREPFTQPPLPSPQPGDTEIRAFSQESVGDLKYLRGNVEIHFDGSVITADEVDYNELTGETEARGDVRFRNSARQEDLHASKISYNSQTEAGTFYDVHGTVGSATQGGARALTTDNPFYIDGKVVHKTAEHFFVHDGFVTNCDINRPWWTLTAPKTKIVPGKSATVHRGVFRLRKVPLFYFPIFKKSLERLPRRSGFLTPNIGNSSRFGLVLGQSYYWAINRSFDATIGGTSVHRPRNRQPDRAARPADREQPFRCLFLWRSGPRAEARRRAPNQAGRAVIHDEGISRLRQEVFEGWLRSTTSARSSSARHSPRVSTRRYFHKFARSDL